ncbi:hypothetical protein BDA99DRAFT_425759, partial [Phascolomyces articulosus]
IPSVLSPLSLSLHNSSSISTTVFNNISFTELITKEYRQQHLIPLQQLPSWHPGASKTKWKSFWSCNFPQRAHT